MIQVVDQTKETIYRILSYSLLFLCVSLVGGIPVFGGGTGIMAGVNPFQNGGNAMRTLVHLQAVSGRLIGHTELMPYVDIELVAPGCSSSSVIVRHWNAQGRLLGLQIHAVPCIEKGLKNAWIRVRTSETGISNAASFEGCSLGPFYWTNVQQPEKRGTDRINLFQITAVGLPLVVLGIAFCLSYWVHRKRTTAL
jgi:hypothetical protein